MKRTTGAVDLATTLLPSTDPAELQVFTDIPSVVRGHAAERGAAPALTFAAGPLGTPRTELTFAAIDTRTRAVAAVLRQRLRPGDRALLVMPTAAEFVPAFLGCLAAGVIAVPLPVPVDASSTRRVLRVAEDCDAAGVLSLSLVREHLAADPALAQLGGGVPWIDVDLVDDAAAADWEPRPAAAEDTAFLQYTSGSTKAPRGVIVTHGALMHNEDAIRRCFRVTAERTVVSWLPLHHDMGLIGALLQPLITGARSVILDPLTFLRRPATWLETITEERADVSGGPNFAYELCLRKISEQEKARLDLSSWDLGFNGAAPVAPRTLRAFTEAFADVGFRPETHTPCYGLAEVTLLVASTDATAPCESRSYDVARLEQGEAVAVPRSEEGRELVAYGLLDHADVTIVDPATREPLPDGRIGEIWVASDSNGAGYWGDPEASEATFSAALASGAGGEGGNHVRTGDLGFLDQGTLQVTGRLKDLIVYRGRNLHPEDMESDLAAVDPALRPGCAAVFAVPGERDEEAVVVCQEVRAGTPEEEYPRLVGALRQMLSRAYGATARTVALLPPGAIAKTSSGKVQRHLARQRYLAAELPVLWRAEVAAENAEDAAVLLDAAEWAATPERERATVLTRALCHYLQQVTGAAEPPAAEAAPTELGVDSLTAVQVHQQVERLLAARLRPSLVLRAESVAALAEAALAEAALAESAAEPGPVAQPHGDNYPLTHAQRALWFLQRSTPGSYAYNVTRAFRLTGPVDEGRLTAALTALIRRHPVLRLTLRAEGGLPHAAVGEEWELQPEIEDARGWSAHQLQERIDALATRPFDLAVDRLLRAALLRRGDDTVLVLSLHHFVCDLTSLAVLLDQLREAYATGNLAERPELLSPAEHEEAVLATRGRQLTAFWKQELAGELPVLELPFATQRRGTEGATVTFDGDATLLAGLRVFARRAGVTLHNVLLASFQTLLHRVSGQQDLVVGVPVAGRTRPELARSVGYLVNVVPVRSGFAPGTSFADFATATHRRMLDALDHQELPFPLLTQQLNPDRGGGAPPIFQAMFSHYTVTLPGAADATGTLLGDPDAALDMGPGITLHGYPVADRTTQSDVGLNVVELADGLQFGLSCDTTLLPPDRAAQLASAYRALLAAVAADPQTDAARLPLVDEEGRGELLALSTGPVRPREEHYLATFERQAARTPDAEAVDDGAERLTYAVLNARANHVARQLREAGAGPETTVVLCAGRSAAFLTVLLGIHKTGACYVPIGTREAPSRVADMMGTLRAAAVVGDEGGRALIDRALHGRDDFDDRAAPPVFDVDALCEGTYPDDPPPATTPASAAYIIHTSGSTGVPKAAIVTAGGLTNHLWQMIEHFGVHAGDCVGQTAPATFDISLWQFLAPLMVGGRLRVVDDAQALSPARLRDAVVESRTTLMEVVPVVVAALLEAGIQHRPHALRTMISGGEALSWETADQWLVECSHVELYNAYGPTECADDVSIHQVTAKSDRSRPVSIGAPLANTTAYILDDRLELVPQGMTGALWVGGLGVGRGYLGNPARTAEVFIPDPYGPPGARLYRTGDLARYTSDGNLEYLGRVDRQVKMRGLRIEPGEVEAALRETGDVVDAVAKVHRTAQGMSLVAHVVTGEDCGEAELSLAEYDRLRRGLADRLPRHMIPTVFRRIPALPRFSNGKIDYGALVYEPAPAAAVPESAPGDHVTTTVRTVWGDLLDHAGPGSGDNFFLLGGHSLLALRMIDRVGQKLGVDLEVDTVFAHPTLGEFIEAVRRTKPRSRPTTPLRKISRVPVTRDERQPDKNA